MTQSPDDRPSAPAAPRRPYREPSLRVFGSVAAITATLSMGGQSKDGGPNNIKP